MSALGKLDAILAWPEEVPGLDGESSTWVLTDPFTLNKVSLGRVEALLVLALQGLQGEGATMEDLLAAAQARFGLEVGAEEAGAVLARLGALGFFHGMDFASRFGHQQWHLAERHKEIAGRALARLVAYAKARLPYYRETIEVEVNGLAELGKLPCITKDQLRANLPRLLPEDGLKRLGAMWQSTSGTTGDRLQVPHDGAYFERGMMATYSLNPVTARRTLGHPFAVLTTPVCSGTECHMVMELPYEKRLWGGGYCLYLNSTTNPARFTEAQLAAMVEDLNRLGPKSMNADAAYLVAFARHVIAKRPSLPKLDAITLTFEVPSKLHVDTIREAFGCPVFEDYSANEVGAIAMECAMGSLHTPSDYAIVEVLDRDKQPVAPGELGRLHITTLRKSAMPLIRYETADLARALAGPCHCGSPHPAFGKIEGRSSELILAADGRPLTPRAVDAVVAEAGAGIGWYSLAQRGPASYRLSVVEHGAIDEAALQSKLTGLLGAAPSVERVKELKPAASGKFRLCHQETRVGEPEALF